ncbi:prephenate dehydrogenase [Fusobacterium sp. PH5-44]|uniref:prephenate dehydrogenase n=1 Tax=unclassified Fusobacterium TaxID=2648384 RepID=UPI003D1D9872
MKKFHCKMINISIVGLGVIGASYGMALRNLGYTNIYGIDTNINSIEKGKKLGIIKEGFTDGKQIFPESDLIILAIYPTKMIKFFKENMKYINKDDTIVTDVGGIKQGIIDEIIDILPENIDFIFGHPMAGREKSGIDYASEKVFEGANYIITPTKKNKPENIKFIEKLVLNMGFAQVKKIDAYLHDKIIGFTSQLTHVMAVALMNSEKEEYEIKNFVGDSFRDLTRIAKINEELWTELFLQNKNNLIDSIESFQKELIYFKNAIIDENTEEIKEYLKLSTKKREKLDK